MKNILIIGSTNRIGLEITRQYLELGSKVFGVSEDWKEFDELFQLGSEYPEQLFLFLVDVTDSSTPKDLYQMIKSYTDRIDNLINIIDTYETTRDDNSFGDLDRLDLVRNIHSSAISPLMIIQSVLPLLNKSKDPVVLNISSAGERIDNTDSEWLYSSMGSRAALMMYMKILADELNDGGIKVRMISRYGVSDKYQKTDDFDQMEDVEFVSSVIHDLDNNFILDLAIVFTREADKILC